MRRIIHAVMTALICITLFGAFGSLAEAAALQRVPGNNRTGVPSANVNTAVVTAESGLNMRKTMSITENNKLTAIPQKAVVSIISREANNWFKVSYKNYIGYVKGGYLADNPDVLYTSAKLRLRSTRDTTSTTNILTEMPRGAKVEVIERTSSTWFFINYDGRTGYALAEYLKKKEDVVKTIDLKDVKFEDITVYYDGKEHALPKVTGLPADVIVTYTSEATHTDIGDYLVKASFKAKNEGDQLLNAGDKTASLSITVKKGLVYTVDDVIARIVYPNTRGNGTVIILKPESASIKKFYIPGVVTIGGVEFSVTEIRKNAFKGLKKLVALSVPNSVTKIGTKAFANCPKLKSVKLGRGVEELGAGAFYKDSALVKLYIKSSKLKTVGAKAFKGTSPKLLVNVPDTDIAAFKKLLDGKGLGKKARIQ